ncbi:MAG: hypothetical protein GY696_24780, partial [Gammaproteobacteria bacterium]|nr:hypothetical protein [Gammaproteobacteria bacterium]
MLYFSVYNVGVEVRAGQGAYKKSQIVIVTPLFTLDNRSKHKLYVAQEEDIDKPISSHLAVSPNCYLAWHWQHQVLDNFLCVKRADVPHWSAGFRIDRLHSFHLTLRDREGGCHFLRVEVILHGAMYYCTFSDTDYLPPPIRVENWSEVPVLYRQHKCDDQHMKQIVRPHNSGTVQYRQRGLFPWGGWTSTPP